MKLFRVIVGELETNCYIVSEGSGSALVVDPGADASRIAAEIERHELCPKAVILTHGHYDHIGAAPELAGRYNIPIYAHEDDIPMLADPEENFSLALGNPITLCAEPISAGVLASLGFDLDILHLPGHTPGSIGFVGGGYFICGDTVFAGGAVGRTDFPHSSPEALAHSIRKILTLPDELILCPGHGGRSLLGREKPLWRETLRFLTAP